MDGIDVNASQRKYNIISLKYFYENPKKMFLIFYTM